jgi:hypothetical protein
MQADNLLLPASILSFFLTLIMVTVVAFLVYLFILPLSMVTRLQLGRLDNTCKKLGIIRKKPLLPMWNKATIGKQQQ